MEIILLCISVNVMLVIIFKLFPKYGINNFQAIIVNYFTCLAVGTIQMGNFPIPTDFYIRPWFPYVSVLSVLFIIGFNMNAASTQIIGISYTTLVQKLSLIIPTIVAVLFFNEGLTGSKIAGIFLAIAAIILIQMPSKKPSEKEINIKNYIGLASGVFLISGAIELILFYMSNKQISTNQDIAIVSSAFAFAGLLGLVILLVELLRKKAKLEFKNIVAGIILGIPNFYSIYLLVYLLNRDWEASVLFPTNNVGIIALSALAALLFFQEKLNIYKWLGLGLAIASIIFISLNYG